MYFNSFIVTLYLRKGSTTALRGKGGVVSTCLPCNNAIEKKKKCVFLLLLLFFIVKKKECYCHIFKREGWKSLLLRIDLS